LDSIPLLYEGETGKVLELDYTWNVSLASIVRKVAKRHPDKVPSRLKLFVSKKSATVEDLKDASQDEGSEQEDVMETKGSKVSVEDFEFLKVLGRGAFAKVVLVRHKASKKVYAAKVLIKKMLLKKKQVAHTIAERDIMRNSRHPFVIHLNFAFQTKTKLYLIMDVIRGGELFFHLRRKSSFSEEEVRVIAAELALALDHVHNLGYLYRDLKPENILLDDSGHVVLTDFGLAKKLDPKSPYTTTICGTPEYLGKSTFLAFLLICTAPEVHLGHEYGKAIDWYSLGVLIYELTSGFAPFMSENYKILVDKICFSKLRFEDSQSDVCKDIISRVTPQILLVVVDCLNSLWNEIQRQD
jgi:serine/threonine protein kinase